jgi:hypothetical protein
LEGQGSDSGTHSEAAALDKLVGGKGFEPLAPCV